MNSSRDAGGPSGPITRARTSNPENTGPQITSQHPTHSLAAPQAEVRPLITPSAPPVSSTFPGNASNTDTGESSSKTQMPYEENAIAPATRREHSIYPVNSQLRKFPEFPEASIGQQMRPRDAQASHKMDTWKLKELLRVDRQKKGLTHEVWKEGKSLWAEKESRINVPSRPATATSENTNRPDRNAQHQSDVEISGTSASRGKARDTRGVSPQIENWDNVTNLADSPRDFTMFEDTPGDQYLTEEKEEVVFSPWNVMEPNHTPSISALSSMKEWDPNLDQAFQMDAEWNLEKWDDMRFKMPQTPTDRESLQQALEITRMDFWIRNPMEEYPEDLSQYGRESYGCQHRRLQHAFCREWPKTFLESPPELYRLPVWNFGFDECYWKPSNWGFDIRSNAYYQGLADMAAFKEEKGLQSIDLGYWKARLKEQVEFAMAHCDTELALYAGPEKE